MKQSFAQILDASAEELRKKLFRKVPSWESADIRIPGSLCVEQCSSEETGLYKATLADRIAGKDGLIVDLTGGLGVDSWAFAQSGRPVIYNEMNTVLADAARSNFAELGICNINVISKTIMLHNIGTILNTNNKASLIYLDPARRNQQGRKVFLIEDCQPDILGLKDEIFKKTDNILVKLSPMADITMVAERLGECVREIHVVEAGRECKEILVWMRKGWSGGYSITASGKDGSFSFRKDDEAAAEVSLPSDISDFNGRFLYEPGPALMKAAPFKLICQRFGMKKAGHFSHLYISSSTGRKIVDVMPFNNMNVKVLGKSFPKCEVTARNIRMSSDDLRRKMGVSSGGDVHIFATTCDYTDGRSEKVFIVTS